MLQLGNGDRVELNNKEILHLQDRGRDVKVADGKVSYVGNNMSDSSHRIVYDILSVSKCAEYQVVLSNGTKVWLNADSELKYPVSFGGREREVFVKGEAYFEVAKDSLHPFIVKSGGIGVEVLGTCFNVRAYQGSPMRTTLVSGSVKILYNEDELILKPGQQCKVAEESCVMMVYEPDLDVVLAWKNGKFIFKDAPLSAIMEEIKHYYGVEVEYEYDSLKDKKFYLYIERSKKLEEVLRKMTWTGSVKYRMEGKKVIMYE